MEERLIEGFGPVQEARKEGEIGKISKVPQQPSERQWEKQQEKLRQEQQKKNGKRRKRAETNDAEADSNHSLGVSEATDQDPGVSEATDQGLAGSEASTDDNVELRNYELSPSSDGIQVKYDATFPSSAGDAVII